MKFKKNLNWFLRVWTLGLVARFLFPTKVVGRDHIPRGPFVLVVGPHKSMTETVLVPAFLQEHEFHIMAKVELFKVPGFGPILRHAGGIPVTRSNGRGVDSIAPAVTELEKGYPILVFPEGTRFKDNNLHNGRTGAVRIALKADVPIVIVALQGMRKGGPYSRRAIIIASVFHPTQELRRIQREMGKTVSETIAARLLTDRMMEYIANDAGTPYLKNEKRDRRA